MVLDKEALKYIDYDLDVKVFPKKGTATSITAPNGYKQAITAGATILNS